MKFIDVYSFVWSRVPLQGVIVETSARAGQYDISATALLHDDDLDTPTVFYCELRIPDTTYAKRKSIVYYPGIYHIISYQCRVNCSNLIIPLTSFLFFSSFLPCQHTHKHIKIIVFTHRQSHHCGFFLCWSIKVNWYL